LDLCDRLAQRAEGAKKTWVGNLEKVAALKQVTPTDKNKCQGLLRSGFESLQRLARASYRPIPPAEMAKCKRCSQGVLLVTNGETGKKTYLDPEPNGGPWRLEGGLAMRLPKSLREGNEHTKHAATCPQALHHQRRRKGTH
jgi:hypothetical protein